MNLKAKFKLVHFLSTRGAVAYRQQAATSFPRRQSPVKWRVFQQDVLKTCFYLLGVLLSCTCTVVPVTRITYAPQTQGRDVAKNSNKP